MKICYAFLILLLSSVAVAETASIEATTKIDLPVDSVTIYPDGLVAVRHTGTMEVTEGVHEFVVDVPSSASMDSVLFLVSNSELKRIVYDSLPTYTIDVLSSGAQRFSLSYLMYYAGTWLPGYSLHLLNDSMIVSANAVVGNDFDQDMKDVRLKLVTGPTQRIPDKYALPEAAPEYAYVFEEAPPEPSRYMPAAGGAPTGELETLFIFEIENRTDLETGKVIGLPLFEEEVPVERLFTWKAYDQPEGPVSEEIRANNTMKFPWPAGVAFLYTEGDYVTTVELDYTPTGSNASLVIGSSAGLKVTRKLADYNLTEEIIQINGEDNATHAMKVTTENWTYQLELESRLDKPATVEVTDYKPMEAELVKVSPQPEETTATELKWVVDVAPREKGKIEYTYRIVEKETLDKK